MSANFSFALALVLTKQTLSSLMDTDVLLVLSLNSYRVNIVLFLFL